MLHREIILAAQQPSLAEFKSHIRVTSNDLDADLTAKLKAAVIAAEHEVGLIIAKSRMVYSGPYVANVPLRTPLVEVTGVRVDGNVVTDYSVVQSEEKEEAFLQISVAGESVEVEYVAGLDQVPWDMKAAILLFAARLFHNPVDSVETLPTASKNLLRPYRSWGLKHQI